jgi:hypothetical protein
MRITANHIIFTNIFLLNETKAKMVSAVLINEGLNDIQEIDLDISPERNEIYNILGGRATFVGQWEQLDVVIIKRASDDGSLNLNKLPSPFYDETIFGPILLVRMDEESENQDFTLPEYTDFSLFRRDV